IHVCPPHSLQYLGDTTAHQAEEGHRSRRSCPLRRRLAPGPTPFALGCKDVGGFREPAESPTACAEVRPRIPLCNGTRPPSHLNDPKEEPEHRGPQGSGLGDKQGKPLCRVLEGSWQGGRRPEPPDHQLLRSRLENDRWSTPCVHI